MSPESASEPKNLEQVCALQEQLLQRCLPVVESVAGASGPALDLLDDLRAHVDPDAPPPADARLLAAANAALLQQMEDLRRATTNFADWYGPLVLELASARRGSPEPGHLVLALTMFETFTQAEQAVLDVWHSKPGVPWRHVEHACIQAAAMAIRVLEEGGPIFEGRP